MGQCQSTHHQRPLANAATTEKKQRGHHHGNTPKNALVEKANRVVKSTRTFPAHKTKNAPSSMRDSATTTTTATSEGSLSYFLKTASDRSKERSIPKEPSSDVANSAETTIRSSSSSGQQRPLCRTSSWCLMSLSDRDLLKAALEENERENPPLDCSSDNDCNGGDDSDCQYYCHNNNELSWGEIDTTPEMCRRLLTCNWLSTSHKSCSTRTSTTEHDISGGDEQAQEDDLELERWLRSDLSQKQPHHFAV